MGLKTTNYKLSDFGIVLPEAYSLLMKLEYVANDVFNATFNVHVSRELVKREKPLERKTFSFKWDRKSDIVKTAYNKSKEKFEDDTNNIFTGWEDDIIKE